MVLCVLLIIATAITEITPANLGYAAEEQQPNAVETESATNSTLLCRLQPARGYV